MSRLSPYVPLFLVLAGCANPPPDAKWTSPGFDGAQWRGKPIQVECRSADTTLALICNDRLAARLVQAGANVSRATPVTNGDHQDGNRPAGAAAILSMSLEQVARGGDWGWGPTIGIGAGNWGGGSGGAVGISLPIGGGPRQDTLEAQAQLLRAGDGQVQWSASARTEVSGDRPAQLEKLVTAIVEALRESGVLP
ncbi:MAG: hypothetical protein IPN00_07585 [Hydrogenophilales bacterium]|jgi:hypothetical protein|nr:hypothetical protein [Hydrogenophilales bacterium]